MKEKNYYTYSEKKRENKNDMIASEFLDSQVEETEEVKIEENEEVKIEENDISINCKDENDMNKEVTGKVSGCSSLRIRSEASTSSSILGCLSEGSEVIIDLDKSNLAFYKVCTAVGVEGYCMREFITII